MKQHFNWYKSLFNLIINKPRQDFIATYRMIAAADDGQSKAELICINNHLKDMHRLGLITHDSITLRGDDMLLTDRFKINPDFKMENL